MRQASWRVAVRWRALSAVSLAAATSIGCGSVAGTGTGTTGDAGGTTADASTTADAGGATGTGGPDGGCSQLRGVTPLLSSPLPTSDVYGGATSDGQYVYFEGQAAIYRVAVSGGTLETVYSGALPSGSPGYSLAAKGGTIAWMFAAPGSQEPAGITVQNAGGRHDVALTSGAVPENVDPILVDADGDVFFEVSLPSDAGGARTFQTWRWNPATGSAAQMPGVATRPDGGSVNLYWADRGQLLWAWDGVYATDIATGTAHPLDTTNAGFGSLVGVDATNVYGAGSICPDSACPFTIWGTPRGGGPPFVACRSPGAYWTNGLQADDSGLYWVDWSTDGIYRAALTNGAPAQLVAHLGPGVIPSQFAMDACNVYWIDANGTGATQQVMAAPK